MDPVTLDTIDRSDSSRFAAFGLRPGEGGRRRADRRRRVVRVRRSLATAGYENDLKLSIALDRLIAVLERS